MGNPTLTLLEVTARLLGLLDSEPRRDQQRLLCLDKVYLLAMVILYAAGPKDCIQAR